MTDPTKREVLTGHELETAYWSGKGGFRFNLRCVEQAVVAKLLDNNFSPYVSPAEARERERRAWDAAVETMTTRFDPPAVIRGMDRVRDDLYPPPTPPKPEGVTLSDGRVWLKVWLRTSGIDGWTDTKSSTVYSFPPCRTPEDFEKVARYLREMAP